MIMMVVMVVVMVMVMVVVVVAAKIKTGSNGSILSILLICITPTIKSIFNYLMPRFIAVNMATLSSMVDT
jgi:hypothetical protein